MSTRARQEGWRLQGDRDSPGEPGTWAVIQVGWPGMRPHSHRQGAPLLQGSPAATRSRKWALEAAAPVPAAPAPPLEGLVFFSPTPFVSSLPWQDQLSTRESPVEGKDPRVLTIGASDLGFHEALGGDSPQWLRRSPALREGGHPPGSSLPGLGAAEATFGGGGWRFRGKRSRGGVGGLAVGLGAPFPHPLCPLPAAPLPCPPWG